MKKHETRFIVILAIFIALALFILPRAWAVNVPLNVNLREAFGRTCDRVTIQVRYNNTIRDSNTVFGQDIINTTLNLGADTSWMVVLLVTPDSTSDSISSWAFGNNFASSGGIRRLSTPAYWNFPTDSVVMDYYVNGTRTITRTRTGVQSYDTSYAVSPFIQYSVDYKIYASGADRVDWYWTYWADTTGGSNVLPSPGTPQQCALWGLVRDLSGTGIRYANVTITLPENVYDSCGGGVIFQKTIKTKTDGSGRWGVAPGTIVSVPRSRCMSNKPVTITVQGFGIQTITRQITVPDSSSHFVKW